MNVSVVLFLFRRIFEFRKVIGDRELCKSLVPKDYPVYITKVRTTGLCGSALQLFWEISHRQWPLCEQTREDADCRIHDGFFTSPLEHFVPGILPAEAVNARYWSGWQPCSSHDIDVLRSLTAFTVKCQARQMNWTRLTRTKSVSSVAHNQQDDEKNVIYPWMCLCVSV